MNACFSNFSNISASESNHMVAIKTMLDRYNLPDPALGTRLVIHCDY